MATERQIAANRLNRLLWRGHCPRDGRKGSLSGWSKARHLIHCRAIFGAALEWGYLDRNPFRPALEQVNSPLRINAKARPWPHLTPEQFHSLLGAISNVHHRAAVWLMYGCGLRPGEVYNLTIDKVDLDRRRLSVENRAGTKDLPPFSVKADTQAAESKERTVPVLEPAVQDIAAALRLAFRSGGFVVLAPERFAVVQRNWRLCRDGEGWAGHRHRPWQNRDMMNNLLRDTKRYLRKAGIELAAPFTLQAFRKSFGQNHADAGTPPRTLARLLGHSNTRVTLQYYNRVTDANERAAGEAMDRILRPVKPKQATRDAV